jgi:DNA adenine methylase
MSAKPFLKWPGGKRHLLPEILPRLPKKIKTYYEPFIGGGAVFFALANERRFGDAVLGDTNIDLVNVYCVVASGDREKLIATLFAESLRHSEINYYRVRAQLPSTLSRIERASRFIYLNRTCFNGLYRVNKSGQFNVPFGAYKNPTICDGDNLRAVSKLLREAHVEAGVCDFEHVVQTAKKGDAVYFDPPYVPVSATSNFTAYGKDGFGKEDQIRLRDVASHLDVRGVHVLLSNSDTPFVRELYKRDFKIEKVEAPRRINSKGGKRGNVGELLISGRKQ